MLLGRKACGAVEQSAVVTHAVSRIVSNVVLVEMPFPVEDIPSVWGRVSQDIILRVQWRKATLGMRGH